MSFWQRFLGTVRKDPSATAIRQSERSISYGELAARAASVGDHLKSKGAGEETLVAIEMEKSIEYITAMLGCWHAGAAFVPLPPSLPVQRRDHILREAGIRHILTPDDIPEQEAENVSEPAAVTDDTLAYVIFTSGSTGKPKGVMVEHRGIVSFIEAQQKAFGITAQSRYLFYLSILFDAAVSDIGVCLLGGATLLIEPDAVTRDGAKLVPRLRELSVTHMDIPPSLLKVLSPDDMPGPLETVIIGGEACPPDTVRAWAGRFRVVNVYGPTEATVCTSLVRCDAQTWEKPLIGAPLPGIAYHVLDEEMNECAEGELYISGIGLARGYLKQPELTAQKFLQWQGLRVYKSGDKVRRHEDGSIEFLGRLDRQFKLRGQLIEPGEIEARILTHPAVRRAAVLKRDEQLVSFAVRGGAVTAGALQAHVAKALPAWMIPQHVEFLDEIPETPTGKADYKALGLLPLTKTADKLTPPATPTERRLWDIWMRVLRHDGFGITDDFFSAGGDSLGVLQMTLEAERQGLLFGVTRVNELRTIERLAAAIDSGSDTDPATFTEWLKEDVAFGPDWQVLLQQAAKRPANESPAPRNILLTGAAGFLGSHVLRELLSRTDCRIYCVIRADDIAKARQRILGTSACATIAPELIERIVPLCGDLAAERFGLPEAVWKELAEEIDTVYHCAAQVNMVLSYRDLRPPNVGAAQQVLRFACLGARKRLHVASTLSVFVATDRNEARLMEDDRLEETRRVYGGYAQTKWAAEWMLLQVPRAACDITNYRFGLITGDTKTGRGSANDFLAMFVRGMDRLNAAPDGFDDALHVDVTPVDHAAAAMVELSLKGNDDIYHIANPQSLSLGNLLAAMGRKGICRSRLPLDRWRDVAANLSTSAEDRAAILSLCRCFPKEEFEVHRSMDLFQATGVTFDMTRAKAVLQGSGIDCPPPSDALIDLYMNHFLHGRRQLARVCIFGPESTGKSTLAEKLARHYETVHVPEYAKELIEAQDGEISAADIPRIAQGQISGERQAAAAANRLLVCDTDLITTTIWSDWLFKSCPGWIGDAAGLQQYDLYLLMDVDTPWVPDIHRYLPEERASFFARCKAELDRRPVKYAVLSGTWEEKFAAACAEINGILGKSIVE